MFAIKSLFAPALGLLTPGTVPAKPVNNPVIVNHVHVIGELKERFKKKEEVLAKLVFATKTPTLSFLQAMEDGKFDPGRHESPKDTIKHYKKEYGAIIDQAIEREQEFCNDYYVFYHGMPNSFYIFHDFLKQLHTFLEISGQYKDFEFLRMWQEAEKEIDANKWLTTNAGYDIKTLIFVNLSLFGNLQNSSSHSFGYFKNNEKVDIGLSQTLLTNLFKHYGFDSAYIQELLDLNQKYVRKEGQLIQFFIPKDKVDQYVFLGSGTGGAYYTNIVSEIWNSKLGRHTKIAPILDKYIEDINSISNFNYLQACILSSQDFLLNPSEDIKIFKYTTLKDKDAQKYEKELKQLGDKIFSEWITTKAYKNMSKTGLGRLIDYMK